jgi:putative tryptophan/tyrosine transport system substrate-binding protein
MKKNLIVLAACSLACLSLAGCNNGASVKKIGILQFGTFDALSNAEKGFVSALESAGFKDGDKIIISLSNPETDSGTNKSMADTLAAGMDLVYGIATPSATALKNSVDTTGRNIPVIFSAVTDPVGAKLVDSLSAPGHNVTGMSDLGPIEDELNLLKLFNGIDKVATLITGTEANSIYQESIASKVIAGNGWTETAKNINNATEITAAVTSIANDVDALWIPTDDTIAANIATIKTANESRTNPLIVLACDVGMINGAVVGMGVDYTELGKQAGEQAVKILNGTSPSAIPVGTGDKSLITINRTWATALGLTLPDALLSTAGATII